VHAEEKYLSRAASPLRTIGILLLSASLALSPFSPVSPVSLQLNLLEPISYYDGCHLSYNLWKPGDCFYGDLASETTVYLVGDSHAAQWLPGLVDLANSKNFKVRSLTKSGCPLASIAISRQCTKWNKQVVKEISLNSPYMVIVSNMTNNEHILSSTQEKQKNLKARIVQSFIRAHRGQVGYNSQFENGFDILIASLSEHQKVVVLEDTPIPKFQINDCLLRNGPNSCDFLEYTSVLTLRLKLIAQKRGLKYISTKSSFCRKLRCVSQINGRNVYRDSSHISDFASRRFFPRFLFTTQHTSQRLQTQ
jgi:hypothetical protein